MYLVDKAGNQVAIQNWDLRGRNLPVDIFFIPGNLTTVYEDAPSEEGEEEGEDEAYQFM